MSLRLQLALWSGTLIGLAMLLVGLLAYSVHSRNLYADIDSTLATTAEHASEEYLAHRASGPLALAQPDVGLRVYDQSGQVVTSSPSANLGPSVDPRQGVPTAGPVFDPIIGLAPSFAPVDAGRGAFGLATGGEGVRWRLYLLPVDGSEGPYLLATAPLDRVDTFIRSFRWIIGTLAAVGAMITSVAGWLVADRTLRPVGIMTETAGAITRSRSFKERVQIGPRPDELGRLGTTLNEMLSSLEQAYQAQQRFVSDASHELRAPLTAIQANLELLRRQPDMPQPDRDEAVEEASREATRLTQLVADLLALARADAGMPLRLQRVDLDRVVLEALAQSRHLARGQSIKMEALEPVQVHGDPDRLKQLLLILLDNALKYTPSNGLVSVAMRRDGNCVEVAVRDTGVGIAAEELSHVFERFYRADPARSRDPGGTGLGLPIARWIAGQHGGDVILASELGRGTTATVHLPAA